MASPEQVAELQALISKQAEIVRELKEANAPKDKLKQPVEELKRLKTALETLVSCCFVFVAPFA